MHGHVNDENGIVRQAFVELVAGEMLALRHQVFVIAVADDKLACLFALGVSGEFCDDFGRVFRGPTGGAETLTRSAMRENR